jgi:hypothetical protein
VCAPLEYVVQVASGDVNTTLSRTSSRYSARQTTGKFLEIGYVLGGCIKSEKPNSAIDVKPNSSGGDSTSHLSMFHIGGHNAADGETIAIMPVSHRPCIAYNSRERGGVDELFWTPVISMPFDVGSVRDESSIGLHGAVSMNAHGSIAFVDEVSAPLRFHGGGL